MEAGEGRCEPDMYTVPLFSHRHTKEIRKEKKNDTIRIMAGRGVWCGMNYSIGEENVGIGELIISFAHETKGTDVLARADLPLREDFI
jgi:hypothetical protein